MAISFFPKIIRFFDLFRKQNAVLVESIHLLNEIFDSYNSVNELCKRIVDKEMVGNQISRDISISLAQTFITPIDREDIHGINMAQEKVLNSIRSISSRISLYHFSNIKPGARELVSMLKVMLEEISIMVGSLEKKQDISKSIGKVKQMKIEGDMLLLVSMGEIYESQPENALNFLELIKWSHIYDRIEEAYAESEILANVVEGISLKYS
jgi:predicted phosphate transport protein (TIGR00153 family)